jgi:hypothetical protein
MGATLFKILRRYHLRTSVQPTDVWRLPGFARNPPSVGARALQICVIGCAVKALSHERAHDAVAWEPRWPEPLSRDRTGPQRENATAILCENQKVMLSANRELSSANRPAPAADPMACSARNAG